MAIALGAPTACSSGGGGTDAGADAAPMFAPAECPAPNQGPIGENHACATLGADVAAAATEWPDVATAATPLVYVRSGAAPGGDGSMGRPYADVASGVAALRGGGTVVLARGTYTLTSPVTLASGVAVLGAGPVMGTTVTAPAGASAFVVAPAADASVASLAIGYASATGSDRDVAIDVSRGGTLRCSNVLLENPSTGVRAQGATVFGDRLTVHAARFTAVVLDAGSRGVLTGLLVRNGLQGLLARDSHVHVSGGLIWHTERQGVSLAGGTDATGGAASCAAGTDLRATGGPVDCFDHVAILCSAVTGLYVSGARTLSARRMDLSGTRAAVGATGADGLFVGGGARVTFDEDIATDAQRGQGSAWVGNERMGALVQDLGTQVRVRGALVASNRGPGLLVQGQGSVAELGYSRVVDNTAYGVAVTPTGSLVEILCSAIGETRVGVVTGMAGSVTATGDGLMLSSNASPVRVTDSQFANNARAAGTFSGAAGALVRSSGDGNRYGFWVSNSPSLVIDGTNRVGARESTPSGPPPLADAPVGP